MAEYQELWDAMNGEYDIDICEKIVKAAGLESEWLAANGENFESVLEKATKILGIKW